MSDTTDKLAGVMPCAAPSEDEIRKWQALPRDEQLRRMRAVLGHSDCSTVVSDSMADIAAAARERVPARRE